MATAKKLKSGSWRCLVFDYQDSNGKKHYRSFTSNDVTPKGKREAERLAASFAATKEERNIYIDITIDNLLDKYIKSKENILSITTITGYKSMRSSLFDDISQRHVKSLKSDIMQMWIGNLSVNKSPKTVKNAYGLFTSALGMFYPDMQFKVKLPQKKKLNLYVPTDNDVKVLIDYFAENDNDMLIAVTLAAFGMMRRSEICALTADDVEGNTIYITKALVKKNNKQYILKSPKTTESTRSVVMSKQVIDMLPKKGNLVNLTPARVSDRFYKVIRRLNIKTFRFHDLRHYSASAMHAIGVPDVYIMRRGGWKSDNTLKNIYRGIMEDYEKKFTDETVDHFDDVFNIDNTKDNTKLKKALK